MKLLLISNSTNAGEQYLGHCITEIKNFLKEKKQIVFIPYAAVTFSYDEYERKVKEKFNEVGLDIISVHRFENTYNAIEQSDAIVIGGGNTFMLLKLMYEKNLLEIIRKKVNEGTPYIGWSAGSNVACPSIRTTNDMPIIEPKSLYAMGLVNFQINPHYLDSNSEGHAGETRQERIEEFLEANKQITVVGLREGTMLKIEEQKIVLIGNKKARIFEFGKEPKELSNEDNFDFLLKAKC